MHKWTLIVLSVDCDYICEACRSQKLTLRGLGHDRVKLIQINKYWRVFKIQNQVTNLVQALW